jgi:hypothetical protein
MRLAFICSSLEPGRDGVGDYTRRLAAECIRQGHPGIILGLNDSRVHEQALFETQSLGGVSISILRLPSAIPVSDRLIIAHKWLGSFRPDRISLQYVCYGYHPRGLAWRWNSALAGLGALARHRHLMFHELWIGPPPMHRQFIGWAQRHVIRELSRCFRPDVVTTSLSSYQRRLSRAGIMAEVLPLFGNITVAPRSDDRMIGLLRAGGSRLVQKSRANFLNGVLFGTIHPDFDEASLIRWLAELQSRSGKPVLLSLIGRAGTAAERFTNQLNRSLPEILEVVSLGEQPEEIISQALQFADFGINTGSSEFLAKSGTFAAMQEHGLPVVLGDGELGYMSLRNDAPPVLQFSNDDSFATILNNLSTSRIECRATSVTYTAANLIRRFESTTAVKSTEVQTEYNPV